MTIFTTPSPTTTSTTTARQLGIAVPPTWRRRSDPDLWVIELDIPEAERLAAETIC